MRRAVASALLCLLSLTRASAAQTLRVEDAVEEALRANDQVRAARYRTESSQDLARSARGQLLPALNASETWQRYNSPFIPQISTPGGPPGPPILAREQTTNLLTLSARQPLVGLLSRSRDFAAASSTAAASSAEEENTRSQLVEQVRTTYLRLFEARAGVTIAQASVDQLQKQLEDAQARYNAGTITKADLLRFQTAAANGRQQVIQASTQALIQRQTLLTLVGRSPAEEVDFVEPNDLERVGASPVGPSVGALVQRAQELRPEILQATRQAEASRASSQARSLALLPEVDIEADYIWALGTPLQFPEHSWFVGVTATWPFFTWGARWYAAQSARRLADAARALDEDAHRQVALDVSTKYANLRAQAAAVEAATTAMTSAEEAYRVTSAQLAAGTATTSDLLDAQAALTTARLNLATARYERAVARVALDRAAMGP